MTNQDDILAEAEQLAELLAMQPEIQEFRQAEERMNALPKVASLMRELRDMQEQIGEFISRNVPEAHYQHVQQRMESVFAELESIPEVTRFMRAQTRLNDLVQSVTSRLSGALEAPADGAE